MPNIRGDEKNLQAIPWGKVWFVLYFYSGEFSYYLVPLADLEKETLDHLCFCMIAKVHKAEGIIADETWAFEKNVTFCKVILKGTIFCKFVNFIYKHYKLHITFSNNEYACSSVLT